jgi:hypothetical protein
MDIKPTLEDLGARLSYKIIRSGASATWEMKISDLPLHNLDATKDLRKQAVQVVKEEFLNATNEIAILNFKK